MENQNIPHLPSSSRLSFIIFSMALIITSLLVAGFAYCVSAGHFPLRNYVSEGLAASLSANLLIVMSLAQLLIILVAVKLYFIWGARASKADRVFLIRSYHLETSTIIDILRESEHSKSKKKKLGRRFELLKETLYCRQTESDSAVEPVKYRDMVTEGAKKEPLLPESQNDANSHIAESQSEVSPLLSGDRN